MERHSPVPPGSRSPVPSASSSGDEWRAAATKLLDEFIHFVASNDVVKKMSKGQVKPFVTELQPWDSDEAKYNPKPQSLSMIKKRLDAGHITSAAEFVHDVREVFLNYLRFYVVSDRATMRRIANMFLDHFTNQAESTRPPLLDPSAQKLASRQKGPIRKGLESILALKKGENAWYFLRDPEEYSAEGLPDYGKHIVKKMWLNKVRTDLEHDRYQSVQDVADDVHLMFQNCIDYLETIEYPDPPDLAQRAEECLNAFDRDIAAFAAPYKLIKDGRTARERLEGIPPPGEEEVQSAKHADANSAKKPNTTAPVPAQATVPKIKVSVGSKEKLEAKAATSKDAAAKSSSSKASKKAPSKKRKSDENEDDVESDDSEMETKSKQDHQVGRTDPSDPLTSDLRKHLEKAIDKLITKNEAALFKQPVDVKKYPEYPNVIKNPMDLKTLKTLLTKEGPGRVRTLDEFLEYGKLIFKNSYVYNDGGMEIIAITQRCEKLFDDFVKDAIRKAEEAASRRRGQKTSVATKASPAASKVVTTVIPPAIVLPEVAPVKLDVDYSMPLTDDVREKLSRLIDSAKKRLEAAPFLAPVDWKALNLPDYPRICPNPMDLGTLQRNLNGSSKYLTLGDFLGDLGLIYRNCRAYNQPGPLIDDLNKLEKYFKQRIEDLIRQYHQQQQQKREEQRQQQSVPVVSAPTSAPAEQPPPKKIKITVSLPRLSKTAEPTTPGKASSSTLVQRRASEALVPLERPASTPSEPANVERPSQPAVVLRPSGDSGIQRMPSLKIKPISVGIRVEHCTNPDLTFKAPAKSEFDLKEPHEESLRQALSLFAKVKWASTMFGFPVLDVFKEDEAFCASYQSMIEKPMDLLTVFIRLSKREYADKTVGPMKCNEDVQLIFSNAIKYNTYVNDMDVVERTEHLKRFWDDVFCEYLDQLPSPGTESRQQRAARRDKLVTGVKFHHSRPLEILKKLTSERECALFLVPVKKLKDLPGYLDVIREPRDLSTIKTDVGQEKYKTYGAFVRDVRLVFANCLLYNSDVPANRGIRESAQRISHIFEQEWARSTLSLWEQSERSEMEERKRKLASGEEYVDRRMLNEDSDVKLEDLIGPDVDDRLASPGFDTGKRKRRQRSEDDDDEELKVRIAKRSQAGEHASGVARRRGPLGSRRGLSDTLAPVSSLTIPSSSVDEEALLGEYERETEIQVMARQEALRKHRMEQRKALMEFRNQQKLAYLSLVSDIKDETPSVPMEIETTNDSQEKSGTTNETQSSVSVPSERVSEGESVSTSLVVTEPRQQRSSRRNQTARALFTPSPQKSSEDIVDLKPAVVSKVVSSDQEDNNMEVEEGDKLDEEKKVEDQELSSSLTVPFIGSDVERGDFFMARVTRRTVGQVCLYRVFAREATMNETLQRLPAGAIVTNLTKGELKITVKHATSGFEGLEEDLADVLALTQLSDIALPMRWHWNPVLGICMSDVCAESRGLVEYRTLAFIVPATAPVIVSFDGSSPSEVKELS